MVALQIPSASSSKRDSLGVTQDTAPGVHAVGTHFDVGGVDLQRQVVVNHFIGTSLARTPAHHVEVGVGVEGKCAVGVAVDDHVQDSPPEKFSWLFQPSTVNLYSMVLDPRARSQTKSSPSGSDIGLHAPHQPLKLPLTKTVLHPNLHRGYVDVERHVARHRLPSPPHTPQSSKQHAAAYACAISRSRRLPSQSTSSESVCKNRHPVAEPS